MTGFIEVDTQALDQLAARIRSAAAPARTAAGQVATGALHAQIGTLGSPPLVRATTGFVESWAGPLADLVADAVRLADAIALVSRTYRDAETSITGRLIS